MPLTGTGQYGRTPTYPQRVVVAGDEGAPATVAGDESVEERYLEAWRAGVAVGEPRRGGAPSSL